MHTLILASQSPRRAALVRLLGVRKIETIPANLEEVFDPERNPAENVRLLALHKARHVAEQAADVNAMVLGADTTVVVEGDVLNKPLDADDAVRMLQRLSGQTHTVYTGVALVDSHTKREHSFVESTDVSFRPLSENEIRSYVASGSPMDKAGAYGIQEDFGAVFVRHIDGDYYNVVGLPLCRLYVALKHFAPNLFE
ncbi:MAG: Maf family protein [Bacteroidota bacterium]|nr:Maf family protein [Bacteroidota bacterium]MDP4233836.1 Maf family protein [Bacteroidota bacterium]MDP4242465.1 Maf family protein [Bacteroidota bacterium]MDP4289053.1 Maf family protein [Bacteroidota bacterium]